MSDSYTRGQLEEACLNYFQGDLLASEVWINKYAIKQGDRFLELTPADMHRRMAREFARIEDSYNDLGGEEGLSKYGVTRDYLTEDLIFELFDYFRYVIPQGSVMAVLGNSHAFSSLSNCVVLPEAYDSYGGILYADQLLAQVLKRRCGVGFDVSSLRPAGAPVANAAATSSGAVSFVERYSNTTREVAQEGRRGALMLTMDIRHPDAEKFALIKQDINKITGANLSLKVSDKFMLAVKEDREFVQQWPLDSPSPSITKKIRARGLWDIIVRCAWNTAEPGIIFWDRQNKYSPSAVYPQFRNISTNPCGEIAMGVDSCRLIALNLFGFIDQPFTSNAHFNFKKFYEVTYEAQRLMDDLVDLELESIDKLISKVKKDPEPSNIKEAELYIWEILREAGKGGRRTGLGFTALADALAALNLKFDSDEALSLVEKVMRTKCEAEFDSSIDLAIQRGSFEGFDPQIEEQSEFVQMLKKELPNTYERMMRYGRRNVSISTVAPTGSLSLLSQTSSGIEPVYTLAYKRRVKINPFDVNAKVDYIDPLGDKWQEFQVHHPKFKLWMETTGKNKVEESPYYKTTAEEINWEARVRLQAAVGKYVTHSISSTINLPSSTTPERVGKIYMKAWETGLKGITVYRDGSRSGVLVKDEVQPHLLDNHAPRRPKVLAADVVRFQNGGEKWAAFIGLVEGRPYEIFTGKQEAFPIPNYVTKGQIRKTKSGASGKYDFLYLDRDRAAQVAESLQVAFTAEFWNYSKLISGVLRHGMPLQYVTHLVDGLNLRDDSLNTWKAGVTRALKRYIPAGTPVKEETCQECGAENSLRFEEGCVQCSSCGWSRC